MSLPFCFGVPCVGCSLRIFKKFEFWKFYKNRSKNSNFQNSQKILPKSPQGFISSLYVSAHKLLCCFSLKKSLFFSYNGNILTHYRIFNFFNTFFAALGRSLVSCCTSFFTSICNIWAIYFTFWCVQIVVIVCKQKYSLTRIKKHKKHENNFFNNE
jgi:hypothetical protein